MQNISLLSPEVQFVGALELEQGKRGVSPRRLPGWTRAQFNVPAMDLMVAMPSGVRLRFDTNSPEVVVTSEITCITYQGSLTRASHFTAVVDGNEVASYMVPKPHVFHLDRFDASKVEFVAGETCIARFDSLGEQMKTVEIWLPQNARVDAVSLEVADGSTVHRSADRNVPRWVHYGSSISHCLEAELPTGTWPAVAAHMSDVELTSLGFAGQCHLDQYVARTVRDMEMDMFTMKVGINVVNLDSMRERTFAPALHGFLDTVRDGHPTMPIRVISPIYCPSAENKPGPTLPGKDGKFFTLDRTPADSFGCLSLTQMRTIIQHVVEQRIAGGDANIAYHDGLQLFGADDAHDMPDDLHPNSDGYRRMGERFHQQVLAPLVQSL